MGIYLSRGVYLEGALIDTVQTNRLGTKFWYSGFYPLFAHILRIIL